MQTVNREQLTQMSGLLAVPSFLVQDGEAQPLNPEGAALRARYGTVAGCGLASCMPAAGEAFAGLRLRHGADEFCTLAGKKCLLDGREAWLVQAVPSEASGTARIVNRIAAARQIMLEISSQIDRLETEQDIYEFILDNCGKAVEHAGLCSLMIVEGGRTRIVAKRGFPDSVYQVRFGLDETFIARETQGRLDRIVIINDLDKFRSSYHLEIKTQESDTYLGSTLSAPIYVNHALYAILNFDSIEKNAFTLQDEELLYVVKSNIEIILANHRMHTEIRRLSRTDLLTGLYNRTCLLEYADRHGGERFTVGVFDLNDLKRINDGHGHFAGDEALKQFAQALRAAFPPQSGVFRIGGDEFLCTLFGLDTAEVCRCVAALRAALQAAPLALPDGASLPLAFSSGFAEHLPGAALSEAARAADRAMYEEKRRFKQHLL